MRPVHLNFPASKSLSSRISSVCQWPATWHKLQHFQTLETRPPSQEKTMNLETTRIQFARSSPTRDGEAQHSSKGGRSTEIKRSIIKWKGPNKIFAKNSNKNEYHWERGEFFSFLGVVRNFVSLLFDSCFRAKVAKEDKTKMIFSETLAQAASILLECFSFFLPSSSVANQCSPQGEKKQLKENESKPNANAITEKTNERRNERDKIISRKVLSFFLVLAHSRCRERIRMNRGRDDCVLFGN